MKAVQVVKPGELKLISVENPVINEHNNVLVRMKAAGICGSRYGDLSWDKCGSNLSADYRS